MKAIVFDRYGPPEVYQLKDIPKPKPAKNEVLIKVFATTATSAEKLMRTGKPFWGRLILGLFRPARKYRIPGIELAGEIEAVGGEVSRFKPKDKVYGFTGFRPGACAEYLCLPQNASLCAMPENFTFEQAAASVDGATTAMFFLKEKAKLKEGQKVLIIGASGSIGVASIQLARHFGAHVTGICSTKNLDLLHSLGAHKTIDYTATDFTKSNEKYDIIFDTVGKSSFAACRKNLTKSGSYIPTTGLHNTLWSILTSFTGGRKVVTGMSVEKNESLHDLKGLYESEEIKPVIDKVYPHEQTTAAHTYTSSGHKKGNVVIKIR